MDECQRAKLWNSEFMTAIIPHFRTDGAHDLWGGIEYPAGTLVEFVHDSKTF